MLIRAVFLVLRLRKSGDSFPLVLRKESQETEQCVCFLTPDVTLGQNSVAGRVQSIYFMLFHLFSWTLHESQEMHGDPFSILEHYLMSQCLSSQGEIKQLVFRFDTCLCNGRSGALLVLSMPFLCRGEFMVNPLNDCSHLSSFAFSLLNLSSRFCWKLVFTFLPCYTLICLVPLAMCERNFNCTTLMQ